MTLVSGKNSKSLYKWITQFLMNVGIVIRNDRCIQRVANIPTTTTFGIIDEYLLKAINRIPKNAKNTVIYANRQTLNMLDIAAMDKSNVNYFMGEEFGRPVRAFRGIRVYEAEAITSTEAVIT